MAVTVAEKWESRESTLGDDASVELLFVIRGTDDDAAANSALLANSPAIYGGLVRQSAHTERIAEEVWEGTVRYGEAPSPGDSSFSFDTGGGSQHLTQSLLTVGSYPAPGRVAPNFRGAIGVTPDAVEGIDVTVPVYHFSETHFIPASLVTGAYKSALFFLTGRVNNAPFKGFAAGEVLFLGASGSKRGADDWEINFKFAASPNAAGISVGTITGIVKAGWDSRNDRDEIRQAWGIGTNELAVGYAGRLSHEKNPVVIARAVALLPNAKLIVCSPQAFDQENPLRREMAELLGQRVVWTNSAAQRMGDVYRGLDCLVVASHEEGMPTVTLEAWLAGLSVVSTPVGLIRELEPRYGPLVDRVPLDPTPEAIAAAIERAVVPNPLRSEVARELVINELSMQRMALEFEELVARLIFNSPTTKTVVSKAAPRARGYLTLTGSRKSR